MRLLLIRHGQTPSNLRHLLDTAAPGPGLTDLGRRQAGALPGALAGEAIGVLYASTLIRTQLTAGPLASERGLEVRVRDGIREVGAGELEMRGDKEAVRRYLTTVFAWPAGELCLRMPGGESGEEALARFDSVVAEACAAGVGTAALVSHGAAIRMWTAARARNVPVGFAAQHGLDNTGVVVLEEDAAGAGDEGWRCLSWTGVPVRPCPAGGEERGERQEEGQGEDGGPAGRTVGSVGAGAGAGAGTGTGGGLEDGTGTEGAGGDGVAPGDRGRGPEANN